MEDGDEGAGLSRSSSGGDAGFLEQITVLKHLNHCLHDTKPSA